MEIMYRWFIWNRLLPSLGIKFENPGPEQFTVVNEYISGLVARRVPTEVVREAFKACKPKGKLPPAKKLLRAIDKRSWEPLPPGTSSFGRFGGFSL